MMASGSITLFYFIQILVFPKRDITFRIPYGLPRYHSIREFTVCRKSKTQHLNASAVFGVFESTQLAVDQEDHVGRNR